MEMDSKPAICIILRRGLPYPFTLARAIRGISSGLALKRVPVRPTGRRRRTIRELGQNRARVQHPLRREKTPAYKVRMYIRGTLCFPPFSLFSLLRGGWRGISAAARGFLLSPSSVIDRPSHVYVARRMNG